MLFLNIAILAKCQLDTIEPIPVNSIDTTKGSIPGHLNVTLDGQPVSIQDR